MGKVERRGKLLGLDTKPFSVEESHYMEVLYCSLSHKDGGDRTWPQNILLLLCSTLEETTNCYTKDGKTDIDFIIYKSVFQTCEEILSYITPEILYVKTGYKKILKN